MLSAALSAVRSEGSGSPAVRGGEEVLVATRMQDRGAFVPDACLDDLLGLVRDYARRYPEQAEDDPPPGSIRSVRTSSARSTSSSSL